jgi:hypothetical protein
VSTPSGFVALGKVYELLPGGQSFAIPVTVQLPYDPSDIPIALDESDLVLKQANVRASCAAV